MNTYQIKNITDTLEKRHPRYNTDVLVSYIDFMFNKKHTISPGKSLYLSIDKLPPSVNKLRLDGLVIVINNPKPDNSELKKKDIKSSSSKSKSTSSGKTYKKKTTTYKPKKTDNKSNDLLDKNNEEKKDE